jgi:hypothetical protein
MALLLIDRNEPSGSVKDGEFLDQMSDCQLLKDSAPLSLSKIMLLPRNVGEE